MPGPLPTVLIPGLLATARLYAEQIPQLWRFGPVTLADHTRDDTVATLARRILATAPPRFALGGLSMGGYVAFEILRQEPERVARLALLDTSARPDLPEQTERRRQQMDLTRRGRFSTIADLQFPLLVHASRLDDAPLRDVMRLMADETGPEAFLRQQAAIIGRPDSRPDLAAIRCPTLVVVGDGDALTPPDLAAEMADGIPGARLLTVPEAGHMTPLERPPAVTQALEALLSAP
jgi:pimeloyl-ACP methyl ester carboxylesterase